MMRWLVFSVAVVAVAAIATVGSTYLAPDPSDVHVPTAQERPSGPTGSAVVEGPMVHNFGVMPQATEGKFEWSIVNKGSGPITLENGGETCSCTQGSLLKGKPPISVAPGETFKMLVTWNTKQWDKFHQIATVLVHNDPEHPKLEFVIDGHVRPPVITYPPGPQVDFTTVSNDAPHPHEIGVASMDRPETRVTGVMVNPQMFRTEVKPLGADECKQMKVERGSKVVVSLKPGAPLGSFNEEMIVETDHPQKHQVKLALVGRVEGPINVSPAKVTLYLPAKLGGSQDVLLLVRGQKSTRFTVEKKPKNSEVQITPTTEAGAAMQYRLTITMPPGLPAGVIDDAIILKTDHPQASELKIPVTMYLRAS